MKDAPPISKQVLDYIDKRFPERCPDINDTDREIWVKTGNRAVFHHLKAVFNYQNNKQNILNKG